MNKKVALINPGKGLRFGTHEPLHLGFIAAYLEEHGVEVRILDELAGQDIEKCLDDYRPDIAGITATTPIIPAAYRAAEICRRRGILTVIGGVHASVLPEEAAKHCDVVVKGEGELAMLDIVNGRHESNIIARPYIKDIDSVPAPARHLMQMDYYLGARDRIEEILLQCVPPHTKIATMLTSRGCPYSCIYCHNNWKGLPYRANSPERVLAEVKYLIERYGVGAIWFNEDHFFMNKARVAKICQMLKDERLGILWVANSRVDAITPEILGLAREAGCREVTFGFESGSNRILKVLNKRTTVEQNLQAIQMCRDAGIEPRGTVMFGNPTETIEDIAATRRFIEKAKLKVGVMITTPYPGTALWKWCGEHHTIPEKFNYEDLDCDNLIIPCNDTMPPKMIKQMQTETRTILAAGDTRRLLGLIRKGLIPRKEIIRSLKHPVSTVRVAFGIGRKILRGAG